LNRIQNVTAFISVVSSGPLALHRRMPTEGDYIHAYML
jgi:hypothetical protein